MAALAISEELNSLFDRLQQGARLMTAIAERNAPIAECFFGGKAKGQEYAWLEANLVFEVARRLARSGVPALIVHDEFIVPVNNEDLVRDFRYTVWF